MKFMLRISILMFAAVVAMAARHDNSKCRPVTITYSQCDTNNKITITRTPPAGVDGCNITTEEVSCVISFTRHDPRENCTQTITTDLTACGTVGGDLNTLMKTITVSYTDCPKDPTVIQIPCSESGKLGEGHRHGFYGGNMMRGSLLRERFNNGLYENDKCKPYTLSYTPCTPDNKMNLTKTPPVGVEGCTPVTEEITCVDTQTSTWGECTQTKTVDNTACRTPGGDLNTLVKTITIIYTGCTKDPLNIQIPCNMSGKMHHEREGMHGGNTRGSWFRGSSNNERHGNDKCKPYTFSYTPCTADNKMNLTKTPPAGVEGCIPVSEEITCVDTQTSKWGECTQTKTTDNTACGTPGGDLNTLVKTITITYTGCTKDPKNVQILCNMSGKMHEREGMHGGNTRGSWFRGSSNNERHGNDKCKPYTLSYTPCTADNKMNLTKTPPAGVEGCTLVTEEITCVDTQTSTWGECTQTKTTDNTACGTPGGDLNTLVKTITITYTGCTLDPKTVQIPCNRSGGGEGFRRHPVGNGMSGMEGSNNRQESRQGLTNSETGSSGFGGNDGSGRQQAGNGMPGMQEGNNRQENGSGRTNTERGRSGFGGNEGSGRNTIFGGLAGMRGVESRQDNGPRQNNKEKARNGRF